MTTYLTAEDLLVLVDDLGIGPTRDLGLLESAAHRPSAHLWGREVYPDIDTKAAALLESVVRNHALVDGNERLGWLAVVVFFGLNAVVLDAPDDDAYELVMDVASGQIDLQTIAGTLGRWH